MDTRISNITRPDVVTVESAPRPTPTPVRVPFAQVLAQGASMLIGGAQAAMRAIPGAPVMALSVRGGVGSPLRAGAGGANITAEGPGGISTGGVGVGGVGAGGGIVGAGGGTDGTGDIGTTLQQSQEMNLYYLQIQQEVDAQNRTFTTYSNVLKAEHDTVKSAIQNIHS